MQDRTVADGDAIVGEVRDDFDTRIRDPIEKRLKMAVRPEGANHE